MTPRTIVITGVNGFVGTHVARIAAGLGHRVWGIGREEEPSGAAKPFCARYFSADLAAHWPVSGDADALIHLAGLASVGPSFSSPQRYLNVNSAIMTTMCESLLTSDARPRVVVVSSGSVYAAPSPGSSLVETSPVSMSSPYAMSKVLVEMQAEYYRSRGLDTVVVRPFNHIGPGQTAGFLVPDLMRAIRTVEAGHALTVGRLDTRRDYTDVRDVATAYLTLALAESHEHDVYNVASGVSRSGTEMLAAIAAELGEITPPAQTDPGKVRPNDPPEIAGDARRIRDEFAWEPRIDWLTSIRDFVSTST